MHGWREVDPREVFAPLTLGVLACGLYAATAAPGLTWAHDGADGGDLITAAITGGVPHPSGYPTYCVLARLFALLPLGPDIARRLALFSATMAAGTVLLVYYTTLRLLAQQAGPGARARASLAAFTALLCASGYTLWSQATIAEVYTLQAFFFVLCFYLALEMGQGGLQRHWFLLGTSLGLGLGVHLTLLLALPGLVILLWPQKVALKLLLLLAAGLSLGLGIYLYMPLAARAGASYVWGRPEDWHGFWELLSGQLYRGYLLTVPLTELPRRLLAWIELCRQQYTGGGLLLSLLGLYSWVQQRRWRWLAATGVTYLAYTLYALTYNTTDSYVYLIPAFLLGSFWVMEGARKAYSAIALPHQYASRRWLVLVSLALLPIWSVAVHYKALDLSRDRGASVWIEETLQRLPPQAALITSQDRHTFGLAYAQWVEGRRQDVLVVDGDLLAQPWYVARIAQREPALRTAGSIAEVAAALGQRRTVFLDQPRTELPEDIQLVPRAPLWEVMP
jgi:hypothetical protein